MSTTELKTYKSKCHCGKFSYEFNHAPLESAKVSDCNCSICRDRGYVYTFLDKVNFTNGTEDGLTTYSFGKKIFGHCFCPVCGSGLLCKRMDGTVYAANLRTVEGIDLEKIDRNHFDGASL